MGGCHVFDDQTLQGIVGGNVLVQPGVTELDQRGGIGVTRVQAVEQSLGHVIGLVGPDPVNGLEVLGGERLGQFYLRWTGASEPEPGWFMLAAERVCSLRDMRKRQKHGLA